MDASYFSTFAALAGSMIGGLTAVATTWVAERTQLSAQRSKDDIDRREALYRNFIEEASRLYADSIEHDQAAVSQLVNLYALVSRMRVLSSPAIVEHADRVTRVIVATYLAPNKTLRDLPGMLDHDAMDPLRDFSNACRDELRTRRLS